MASFTIDSDNNITAIAAEHEADAVNSDNVQRFDSEKELFKLAEQWPGERLVEIWNSLAGVKPVTRFTSRKAGVARIWKAIQRLASDTAQALPPKARPAEPKRKKAAQKTKPATAREGSKKAEVIALLRKPNGATLEAIMKATGWQAHSVRSFISGSLIKKSGLKVESFKRNDGERAYAIRG